MAKSRTPRFDRFVKKFTDNGVEVAIQEEKLGEKALTEISKMATIQNGEYASCCLARVDIYKGSDTEYCVFNHKMERRLLKKG